MRWRSIEQAGDLVRPRRRPAEPRLQLRAPRRSAGGTSSTASSSLAPLRPPRQHQGRGESAHEPRRRAAADGRVRRGAGASRRGDTPSRPSGRASTGHRVLARSSLCRVRVLIGRPGRGRPRAGRGRERSSSGSAPRTSAGRRGHRTLSCAWRRATWSEAEARCSAVLEQARVDGCGAERGRSAVRARPGQARARRPGWGDPGPGGLHRARRGDRPPSTSARRRSPALAEARAACGEADQACEDLLSEAIRLFREDGRASRPAEGRGAAGAAGGAVRWLSLTVSRSASRPQGAARSAASVTGAAQAK